MYNECISQKKCEQEDAMGRFLNPGNEAFSEVIHSEIYVDKTPLLEYTNKVISTTSKFICSSRPRRFGKSITAEMLSAYYSKGCDSRALFADYAICKASSFEKHLNQYDVIHFDVQWCMMDAGNADQVVEYINHGILQELKEKYGELIPDTVKTAYGAMSYIKAASGNKFVVIIDEWDVLIRDEAQNHKVQEKYIDFLRGMFKGSEPSKYIALAYLTGILPIKKLKTQSALNNFEEFTMLDAGRMAPYVGFTEEEVHDLCDRYGQIYEQVKLWYDGYSLEGYQVYNPKAVVSLMLNGKYKSYWSNTGSYEAIVPLINMNFDGLRAVIGGMIPTFLLYKQLGLTNSFGVYVIPGMVSAFNMLVIRTYMNGISDSLEESAQLDGAGYTTIFLKIYSPLCKPVYATVALFVAVGQWNSWFDAMLYNRMNSNLTTLQYELMKLLSSVTNQGTSVEAMKNAAGSVTPTSVRAAATIITMLPIICIYPFLQKYFFAGLTLGGVKE